MNLVFLVTPPFTGSRSMPRFAALLCEGMRERGHSVTCRTAEPVVSKFLPTSGFTLCRWTRHADQYLLFPRAFRDSLKGDPADTLYVVTDQGLGMWVPLLIGRPHVIHCHDLLAIRSALGEFPENPTGLSGRIYQQLILSGLRKGRNFLSVSAATHGDLSRYVGIAPGISEVLPNALNRPSRRIGIEEAASLLGISAIAAKKCPILHVGGNQWYKNRIGVLKLYEAYVRSTNDPHPLWMAGPPPSKPVLDYSERMHGRNFVTFWSNPSDDQVDAFYSLASLLLYPSLEEGFGWPVAEAMARICPVITTSSSPMTEVGGDAAFYLPRMPASAGIGQWLQQGVDTIRTVLGMSSDQRRERTDLGLRQASRFAREPFLDACESFYRRVLSEFQ